MNKSEKFDEMMKRLDDLTLKVQKMKIQKCGKEHSTYPTYHCVLTKGHRGFCQCVDTDK